MSTQAIIQFAEFVASDGELQAAVDVIRNKGGQQAASIVDLAAKHGYSFSADEFVTVNNALLRLNQGELSEAELEGVAGGVASACVRLNTATATAATVCAQLNTVSEPPLSG
jgi:predicted ribosomally synthesized peptide with nif11-like leader